MLIYNVVQQQIYNGRFLKKPFERSDEIEVGRSNYDTIVVCRNLALGSIWGEKKTKKNEKKSRAITCWKWGNWSALMFNGTTCWAESDCNVLFTKCKLYSSISSLGGNYRRVDGLLTEGFIDWLITTKAVSSTTAVICRDVAAACQVDAPDSERRYDTHNNDDDNE